jgi:hypothetical protein
MVDLVSCIIADFRTIVIIDDVVKVKLCFFCHQRRKMLIPIVYPDIESFLQSFL